MDAARSESTPTAAQAGSAPPEFEVPLMRLPLLAWLAVAAAVTDALVNRIGLRVFASNLGHATRVALERWGGVPRNLAAVAGLVALTAGLLSFVRHRGHVSLPSRIGLAGFSGILLPTLLLATVLPAARTTPPIVLLATGAADVLVILLAAAVLSRRGPASLRLGIASFATASLLGFAAIVLGIAGALLNLRLASSLSATLAQLGEVAWLSVPLAFGAALWPREGGARARRRSMVAAGCSLMVLSLCLGAQLSLRAHFADLFYGLTHLTLFLESAPVVYGPLLAVGAGVICLGLLSPGMADRQLAAGLLLLAAAGFAPRAPGLLLYLCLGALLLTRACLARETLAATRDILRTRD